jgi:hypothetical protein
MAIRDRQDVAALIVRLERASVAYSVEKNNCLNESLHALFERAPGSTFPTRTPTARNPVASAPTGTLQLLTREGFQK